MVRRRDLQSTHRRPCSVAWTTSSGCATRLRGCAIIPTATHEQSLLACAAYRAPASDGRLRRLWTVPTSWNSALERVNPVLCVPKKGQRSPILMMPCVTPHPCPLCLSSTKCSKIPPLHLVTYKILPVQKQREVLSHEKSWVGRAEESR